MAPERLFKFLGRGGVAPFSGVTWRPGEWVGSDGPLEPCVRGVHVCRIGDLPYWLNDELWEIEARGARRDSTDKVVVEQARLAGRIDEWADRIASDLGADCVWRVRDLAVRELALASDPAAETLARCTAIEGLGEAARAAEDDAPPGRPAKAAHFVGFAGDAVDYFGEGGVVGARYAAYVAAYAADRATSEERLPPGVSRFALERDRQARRLAELGLG